MPDGLLIAMAVVAVAELGDKTQLVALGLAARHRFAPVLAGITIAYGVTNGIAVLSGDLVGRYVPPRTLGTVVGLLFLGFAVWTLRAADDEDESEVATGRSVVLSIALAIGIAELGDKSMMTAGALAARGGALVTWVGATLGVAASTALAVGVGRALGTRLSMVTVRRVGASLLAAFGLVVLVDAFRG
jgi:Ca2+/H+ antiporter, TMEM165/GDT1 family